MWVYCKAASEIHTSLLSFDGLYNKWIKKYNDLIKNL